MDEHAEPTEPQPDFGAGNANARWLNPHTGRYQSDPRPDPDPRPLPLRGADSVSEPDIVARTGDSLVVTIGPAGSHRFVVVDAHARWLAHGYLTALDFHVQSLSRGRRVLPVRAEPVAVPDAVPDADSGARVHTHRHAHHAGADDFLARTGTVVERYDHTHAHAHLPGWSGRLPDDRSYHDDHQH